MKGLGAGLKVGLLTLIVAVFGFSMWKSVGERASGKDGYTLWAHFGDAQGLAQKSRVVIAGITIGEIIDRTLEGRLARVTVKVRKNSEIYENAIIFKKSSSLLGEYYLDIDPGSPTMLVDGKEVPSRRLAPGEQITNVVEATSTDEIMRQVGQTIPKVDKALDEIALLVADTRKIVNNQITSIADTVDQGLKEDQILVKGILQRADAALADIQVIVKDVRGVTATGDEKVMAILTNLEKATAEASVLIAEARVELAETGEVARAKLERLDKTLDYLEETAQNSASITKKVDGDEGTLGKLVNDPTVYDNVADITTSAKGFTDTLFGLQTIVGMRAEYNLAAANIRSYFSVELWTRNDKFYLVELVSDPKGEIDESFSYDPAVDPNGEFTRDFTFDNGFRFTFQFGKRWNWLGVRLGLKESTGGIGADAHLLGGDLRVSLDVFDYTFARVGRPRVKIWVAYQVARYLYIYAGGDDLLEEHTEIPIAGDVITGGEYKTWSFGRDGFVGASLRFTDEDLTTLLFVGGSALAGFAE